MVTRFNEYRPKCLVGGLGLLEGKVSSRTIATSSRRCPWCGSSMFCAVILKGNSRIQSSLKQHVGKVWVCEFEVSLIIELQQRRAIWMFFFEMNIVYFRFVGGVSAFFTNVHLCPSFFVSILMMYAVNFQTVRFKWTTLGKRFLTQIALVRPDTCVCSSMSLQVKRVIETLSAERA